MCLTNIPFCPEYPGSPCGDMDREVNEMQILQNKSQDYYTLVFLTLKRSM